MTAQEDLSDEAECLVAEADIVLRRMIAVEATAGMEAVAETATADLVGEMELALRPPLPEKLCRDVA
jgi:hypothetical protein